jgi:hypothetical protein
MPSFNSKIWTPKTAISKANFQQMADNDAYVQQFANSKLNYGFYSATWQDEISIAVDSTTNGQALLDESIGQFDIAIHNPNEYWKFGLSFGRIVVISDSASPNPSTTGTTNSVPNPIGVSAIVFPINEKDMATGINTTMANPTACGAVSDYGSGGNFLQENPTHEYDTLMFGLDAQFVYPFRTAGIHQISIYVLPRGNDVSGIAFKCSVSFRFQIYAKCLGSATNIVWT